MFCEVDSKNVFHVYICASGTTPEHGTGITVVHSAVLLGLLISTGIWKTSYLLVLSRYLSKVP